MHNDGLKTILLVTEDERLHSMLRGYLEHVGFVVFGCSDGHHSRDVLCGRHGIDLLVADLQALGESFFRFADGISADYPRLPVIVISESPEDESISHIVNALGWRLLRRPVPLPDVLHSIQSSLDLPVLDKASQMAAKAPVRARTYAGHARSAASLSKVH